MADHLAPSAVSMATAGKLRQDDGARSCGPASSICNLSPRGALREVSKP